MSQCRRCKAAFAHAGVLYCRRCSNLTFAGVFLATSLVVVLISVSIAAIGLLDPNVNQQSADIPWIAIKIGAVAASIAIIIFAISVGSKKGWWRAASIQKGQQKVKSSIRIGKLSRINLTHGALSTHRQFLEMLESVPPDVGKQLFDQLGVTKVLARVRPGGPTIVEANDIDDVFGQIRGQKNPASGDAWFLVMEPYSSSKFVALYVKHKDVSGWYSGLLACKLANGSFITYNHSFKTVGEDEVADRLWMLN